MGNSSEVEFWPIESISPYERNLKVRSHLKVRSIADSLSLYGLDQPLVVDESGIIIKGVGRYEALKMLGWLEVPVLVNRGLSEEAKMVARIADNKTAESGWNRDNLWLEVEELTRFGIDPKALGFELQQLREMFPDILQDEEEDQDVTINSEPENIQPEDDDDLLPDLSGEDPTDVLDAGSVYPFQGESLWLRHLSMVDFLHTHEKILLSFGGGRDSVASLLWCLDNGLRDKLFVFNSSLGWGIEHPEMYLYLKYIEEKAGITIHSAGSMNPRHPGGFEETLLQFGFPKTRNGCWVERELRNVRTNALFKGENFTESPIVQLINVRWSKNHNYRMYFPDRGEILSSSYRFANPLATWKDGDVAKYIQNRGYKLPGMYLYQEDSKCFLCPKNSSHTIISIRKKYPKLWAKVMRYYAIGSKMTGELASSIKKWLDTLDDPFVDIENFTSVFSGMAMEPLEYNSEIKDLDAEYSASEHKIFKDDLQGRPIFKNPNDDFMVEFCKY